MSEDIALEILERAFDADDNLGEDTKRFIDLADPTKNPTPRAQTSPVDLKRQPQARFREATSGAVRRLPEGYARHRAKNKREE